MKYNFPAVKFTRTNTIQEQIAHVLSEAKEVEAAFEACQNGTGSIEHLELELGDLYHSLESLFRVTARQEGAPYVTLILQRVFDKNDERGYYDNPGKNQP